MCGIAGFVNRAGQGADRAIVERMTAALAHRGPDGDGFYCAGPVGPGASSAVDHRRHRRRPADGQRGRHDLGHVQRRAVQRAGDPAASSRRKGIATRPSPTPRAWCISTRKTGSISSVGSTGCSPWPSGTSRASGWCWHATGWGRSRSSTPSCPAAAWPSVPSPRRCLRHPEVGRELDRDSLARYLFYEYIPAPHSIWHGLRKLPRGHVLVWERGSIRVARYWQSSALATDGEEEPFEQAGGRFWDIFRRCGGPPSPVGRAAGGVPLRRRRFLERCRGALRDRAGPERAHLLDRVRGARL